MPVHPCTSSTVSLPWSPMDADKSAPIYVIKQFFTAPSEVPDKVRADLMQQFERQVHCFQEFKSRNNHHFIFRLSGKLFEVYQLTGKPETISCAINFMTAQGPRSMPVPHMAINNDRSVLVFDRYDFNCFLKSLIQDEYPEFSRQEEDIFQQRGPDFWYDRLRTIITNKFSTGAGCRMLCIQEKRASSDRRFTDSFVQREGISSSSSTGSLSTSFSPFMSFSINNSDNNGPDTLAMVDLDSVVLSEGSDTESSGNYSPVSGSTMEILGDHRGRADSI